MDYSPHGNRNAGPRVGAGPKPSKRRQLDAVNRVVYAAKPPSESAIARAERLAADARRHIEAAKIGD